VADPVLHNVPPDQASDPSLLSANIVPPEVPAPGDATNPQGGQAESPLGNIVGIWREKIRLGAKYKAKQFGDFAKEGMKFFSGPYDFLYRREYASENPFFKLNSGSDKTDPPMPSFQMSLNLVAEMVQVFGPVLYHKNPYRKVNPRKVPLPKLGLLSHGMVDTNAPNADMEMQSLVIEEQGMQQFAQTEQEKDEARAALLEWYLNYTPHELDLKRHARRAIDETIIKGMGVLWTELYQPKGAQFKLVGSFWDSVDNLVIDPDAEHMDEAKWVARRCVHPVWEVEREYGLDEGSLKGNFESYGSQAETSADEDGDYKRKSGQTADLICYWKVWSRMGLGGRLKEAPPELRQTLEQFGDHCYLVLAEGVPYPLNLPPRAQAEPMDPNAQHPFDWPTPFWIADRWPFTPFIFHEVPRQIWPMSHLRPALGELCFLNYVYSFLAGKIRSTCRDFLAIKKSAGEELVETIINGQDLSLVRMDAATGGAINEIVQFLQHPAVNGDIWKLLDMVQHNFEKRTGLTELMYGLTPVQMRSAEEAQVKGNQAQVRPDDMATKIEEAMSDVALAEAIAVRWHLERGDIEPIMGPVAGLYWEKFVNTTDLYALTHSLQYRIEAGTARKPNKDRDAANMRDAMQVLFTPLFQYAMQTGNVDPINKLITDWAKSIDLEPEGYVLTPPPPPPDPAALQQQQQEQEAAAGDQRRQQAQADHQQKQSHADDQHKQKLQQGQDAHTLKLRQAAEAAKAKFEQGQSKEGGKAPKAGPGPSIPLEVLARYLPPELAQAIGLKPAA
jgi:hypothetical protein